MKIRELNIIDDPSFYQYTTSSELTKLNMIELIHALSLTRKEQRRLQEKCKAVGIYDKKNASELDKQNYKEITRFRGNLEQVVFDKLGYVPAQITENMLHTLIKNHQKTVKKLSKK
ncbi:hypothetical protein [Enterococcus sp. AZ102]|uniref:hypothetical protein n=1 Tax=unclassified Enterococcus TaxID=2608891 RepID=UPI003F2570BA